MAEGQKTAAKAVKTARVRIGDLGAAAAAAAATRKVTVAVGSAAVGLTVRPAALTVGLMRRIREAQRQAEEGEIDGVEQTILSADILQALVADWDLADPYTPEAVDALRGDVVEELLAGVFSALNGDGDDGGEDPEGDGPNP
jgi:hypothetical protein